MITEPKYTPFTQAFLQESQRRVDMFLRIKIERANRLKKNNPH